MFKLFIFICLLSFLCTCVQSGVGFRPPMGWTDKSLGCGVNETVVQQTAEKLVNLGLAGKGYQYIKLNDCWQGKRDNASGNIKQDFVKFPNGLKALSGSLKNKGLKLGLGSDLGNKTCSGQQGSYEYQKQDALTYANWQVDYVEYTNCNNLTNPKLRYYLMSKSLNETGRDFFYSIENQGNDRVWEWGSGMANSWRTAQSNTGSWGDIIQVLQRQVGLEQYAGVGHWNDPGELLVGSQKLSHNEQYAQFALWCILKAPLFISANISEFSASALQILGNSELIAINQDSLGSQARRVKSQIGSQFKRQVWAGLLSNGDQVVVFLNRGETETTISVSLKNDLSLRIDLYTERDPIRHINSGISNKDILSYKVSPHSVEVRIISPVKQPHLTFQSSFQSFS